MDQLGQGPPGGGAPTSAPIRVRLLRAPAPPRRRVRRRRREEPSAEGGRALAARAPGVLIAVAVHLVGLAGLSLWTIATVVFDAERTIEVSLGPPRERVIGPRERQDGAAVDAEATGALTEPDVGSDHDAPFAEPFGRAGSLEAAARAMGLGAGGRGPGAGGRGGRGGRGGASRASESAIERGLDWLVRHRTSEGVWGPLPYQHGESGEAPRRGDAAHTGLALLCFLCAGHGPERGPHAEVVDRALTWLVEGTDATGSVQRAREGYPQAIAVLAMGEALARAAPGARRDALAPALQRAVRWLEVAQDPAGSWGYAMGTTGDTSVTSWALLGLRSAEHAGATVNEATWRKARRYLESVSRATGETEYRPWSSHNRGLGMTATGLFLRVLFGESPETERNLAAARLCGDAPRVLAGRRDVYALYYTSLAMHQVGGEAWEALNPRLRDDVVTLQRRGEGCERGSWDDDDHWLGDGLVNTAFCVLSLETYYRYLPAGVQAGAAFEPLSKGELLLSEAEALLEAQARRSAVDAGALRAAALRYDEAIAALVGEGKADLVARARGDQVQLAALGLGPAEVEARADACVAAGDAAEPRVLRLRRLALACAAGDAVVAALRSADGLEGAPFLAARVALARALEACAAEGDAAEAVTARQELERAGRALELTLGPAAALDEALAALPAPAAGPAGDEERALVEAVAWRTRWAHEEVRDAGDRGPAEEAFARAEAGLRWLLGRDLEARLPAEARAEWDASREALELGRLVGLRRLRRDADALAGVAAFRARWPGRRELELERVERAALPRRLLAGTATAAERDRLVVLMRSWVGRAAADEHQTPWAEVGQLLLDRGHEAEAERCLARALERPRPGESAAPSGAHLVGAHLLSARLHRHRGQLDGAEARLAHLDRGGFSDLAEVRLERAALLAARGQLREAAGRYEVVVRALSDERPTAWWAALEGLAAARVALGEVESARDLVLSAARKDPTWGGDPVREARFAELLLRLR